MAFITMPAPKVGTTFYDKPGNARKLHNCRAMDAGTMQVRVRDGCIPAH